jgi:FkbM family methyltransferase
MRAVDRNALDRKCCVDQPYLVCYWNRDCISSCTNHSISLFSNCPSSLWLDALSPRLLELSDAPSMLNVGANKGYDVHSFIERFDASWRVTGLRWARLLANHNVTGQPCGACNACGETPLWRAPRNVRVGTVLAVEAESRNAALLSKLAKTHVLRSHDVRVLHAVVTGPGASATSFVPIAQEVGTETARPTEARPSTLESEAVRTTTVDHLLASHDMHTVDLCLIDAEGHDHAVLRGAEGALRAHSLRVVVFEYGGLWCFRQPGNACVRLEPEVAFLERFGYACWWLGNGGDVSRIDPTCEDVSTRRWANVGCVADPGLVAKMRELERFGANAGLGGA